MTKTRIICVIVCLAALLLLLAICGNKTLKVEISRMTYNVPQTFKFVDVSLNNEIKYTKIIFKDKEVYRAVAMSDGVYFAFDKSQYSQSGGTATFGGGTLITTGSTWEYTLSDDGTLKIKK
jgi:hypothetical protein